MNPVHDTTTIPNESDQSPIDVFRKDFQISSNPGFSELVTHKYYSDHVKFEGITNQDTQECDVTTDKEVILAYDIRFKYAPYYRIPKSHTCHICRISIKVPVNHTVTCPNSHIVHTHCLKEQIDKGEERCTRCNIRRTLQLGSTYIFDTPPRKNLKLNEPKLPQTPGYGPDTPNIFNHSEDPGYIHFTPPHSPESPQTPVFDSSALFPSNGTQNTGYDHFTPHEPAPQTPPRKNRKLNEW
jgi:hypothetical protein